MSTAALARAEGAAPEIDGSEDGARTPDAPASTPHPSTTAVAVPVASAPDAAAVLDADCAWAGETATAAGEMGTGGCVCGGLTSTHVLCLCLLCVLLAVAIPLGVVFGKPSDGAAAEPPLPQLPPPTASLPDIDATECSLADFSGDVYAYGMSSDGGGNPFCYRVSLGPSGEFDHGYDAPSCEDYSPRLTIGYYSKMEDSVMHYEGGSELYACDWYGGRSGTVQLVIDDSIDARATASAGETAPCRYDLTITSPSCEAVVRDLGLSWEKSLPQPPPPPEEDQPTTPASPSRIPTTEKPSATATDMPVGADCAARQQMATVLTEDICLRDRTVGAEACPECASSCDYISSGSTFDLFPGSFYTFTVDRQQNGRTGIWFNLLATESDGIYMSLYKGTFCGGLTCVTSRDGGGCGGMQEDDLDNGEYVLFIHGADDAARYDLEFTFKGEGLSNQYPGVCSE